MSDILQWLTDNFQKVNVSRTEMMILSSMHPPPVIFPQFRDGDNIAETLRNVGMIFDSQMHQAKHRSSVVKPSFTSLMDMY